MSTTIDRFRRTLLPLTRSSQDVFLTEQVKYARNSQELILITGPRGVRKSFCALRLANRFFAPPVTLLTEVQTIDQLKAATKPSLEKLFLDVFLTCFGSMAFAAVLWLANKKRQKSLADLLETITKEFPTEPALGVAAISFVIGLIHALRRRVIIFDDPLNAVKNLMSLGIEERRKALGELRGKKAYHSIVILSSNEGLSACFDDTAMALHVHKTFPFATVPEFLVALKAASKYLQEPELYCLVKNLGAVELNNVLAAVPSRYALSIRWWFFVPSLPSDILAALLSREFSLNEVQRSAFRSWLRLLVVQHDLQSAVVFRAEALGLSPPLEPRDREKVAALVGLDVSLLPQKLPGRLALCWALVLADHADVKKIITSSDTYALRTDVNDYSNPVPFFKKVCRELRRPSDETSFEAWEVAIRPLHELVVSSLSRNMVETIEKVECDLKDISVMRELLAPLKILTNERFAAMNTVEIIAVLDRQVSGMKEIFHADSEKCRNLAKINTALIAEKLVEVRMSPVETKPDPKAKGTAS